MSRSKFPALPLRSSPLRTCRGLGWAGLCSAALLSVACASGKVERNEGATAGDTAGGGGGDGGDGADGTTPASGFEVSPTSLELPLLFVGQTHEELLTITNLGEGELALESSLDSALAEAWFISLEDPTAGPGESVELRLALVPTTWGDHSASLTVTDSASGESVEVPVSALVQVDGDGDGVGSLESGGADCNDADASISPELEEVWYDGIDQDCDGADDYDQDGDGVTVDLDCVDTDASTYPGATEVWYDGLDQNCDGADDYDQDADGYTVDADCDDRDGSISPGAEEVWYDDIDQNCDGANDQDQDGDGVEVSEDCLDTDASVYPGADEVWYDDLDGDCSGGSDFDQDGDGVDWPTDCNDLDADITGPEIEVLDGIDNDCDGAVDDFSVTEVAAGVVHGGSGQGIGNNYHLAAGGDMDGDGGQDLAIGSSANTTGYVWVLEGSGMVGASGTVTNYDIAQISGYYYYYAVGNVVGPMGDLDGDGTEDLLTAGVGYGGYGSGWAFAGAVSSGDTRNADGGWTGDSTGDGLRVMVSGDIDGDGVMDLVTGCPGDNWVGGGTTYAAGNVAMFSGDSGLATERTLDDSDDQIHGDSQNDNLGTSLYAADWTGDGYADVLAGGPGVDDGANNAGALFLFAGGSFSWADQADAAATLQLSHATASGGLGNDTLAPPADVDGDGDLDLVVGSETTGAAWLFLSDGAWSGDLDVGDAAASFSGVAGDFASAISYASDLDGDGVVDIAIGDDGNDTAGSNAGALWIFLDAGAWSGAQTSATASGVIWGAAAGDALGTGLGSGADLSGDGSNDLLVGAAGSSAGASGGGSVYLLTGL